MKSVKSITYRPVPYCSNISEFLFPSLTNSTRKKNCRKQSSMLIGVSDIIKKKRNMQMAGLEPSTPKIISSQKEFMDHKAH